MSKVPSNDFTHLWNDLPKDERSRLMPYMIENQILHVWQSQQKAVANHHRLMKEFDDHLKTLRSELNKYKAKGETNE